MLFLMLLHPPWLTVHRQGYSEDWPAGPAWIQAGGYSWFWNPPGNAAGVDLARLLVQSVMVGLVTGGLWMLTPFSRTEVRIFLAILAVGAVMLLVFVVWAINNPIHYDALFG